MDKSYFIGLLHKYLNGESTLEEEQFLVKYYDLFENEPDVLSLLSLEKKEALRKEIHSAIWDVVSKKESGKIRTLTKKRVVVAAAAALLILFIGSVFFMRTGPARKPVSPVADAMAGQPKEQKENHLVVLPDGSTVILSFGSKLDYPSSFEGLPRREVYLTGQAFFDVRKSTVRSFVVHTGKLTTTVLGTSFNIKAYPGDMDITITVKRGAVKVSDQHKTLGIIRPDQQIVYNKQKANSVQTEVTTDNYLDWKQQDLLFDNLTVEEAAKLLEERFNVKIVISDASIGARHFTTTFPRSESLEEALKSICEFNEAVFKYDKEKAIVTISDK